MMNDCLNTKRKGNRKICHGSSTLEKQMVVSNHKKVGQTDSASPTPHQERLGNMAGVLAEKGLNLVPPYRGLHINCGLQTDNSKAASLVLSLNHWATQPPP